MKRAIYFILLAVFTATLNAQTGGVAINTTNAPAETHRLCSI